MKETEPQVYSKHIGRGTITLSSLVPKYKAKLAVAPGYMLYLDEPPSYKHSFNTEQTFGFLTLRLDGGAYYEKGTDPGRELYANKVYRNERTGEYWRLNGYDEEGQLLELESVQGPPLAGVHSVTGLPSIVMQVSIELLREYVEDPNGKRTYIYSEQY